MTSNVNVDTAKLVSHQQSNSERVRKTVEQLSSGKKIIHPGDDVKDYETATILDLNRASDWAQMQAIQSRMSWYQADIEYLQEVRELLTRMSELSINAKSGTATVEDKGYLNTEFQELKKEISSVVDGNGGQFMPRGSFGDIPIFLGYSPGIAVDPLTEPEAVGVKAVNLYTGMSQEGFPVLPFLTEEEQEANGIIETKPKVTGTAQAGSTTSITLAIESSAIDEVYQGTEITITAGTGVGQKATILAYNGRTGTAVFQTPMAVALDNTSEYSIESLVGNRNIVEANQISSSRSAEHVWGADNYRLDHLTEDISTFKPLTIEESNYRTANGIANTDLDPKTLEEKMERRRLNIFDPEFGTLTNKDNASRMLAQVSNAIDQIAVYISREDAKAETLKGQYSLLQGLQGDMSLGIVNASELNDDFAEAAVTLNDLTTAHGLIFEIAGRIGENFGKLTDLVKKK